MRSSELFFASLVLGLGTAGCGGGDDEPAVSRDAGNDAAGADAAASLDAGSVAAPECNVPLPTSCPDPKPHYPDVQPIFMKRCVLCHNGTKGGPWPLTEYEHVADWYDTVQSEVHSCLMPPPDAGVPITLEEREKILSWIRCGYPR
jgi:uncharacterized membrane protein